MPRRPLLKLNDLEHDAIKKALHNGADGTRILLRALLQLTEGRSRQQTAEEARVHPVTVTRWVRRFREYGLESLVEDGPQGRPPKLNPVQREVLNQIARTPPRRLGKHFSRWTLQRLARHFSQQVGFAVGAQYVGRQLRNMGLLRVVAAEGQDSGFQPAPKASLIWVTVATSLERRENASDHRILFAGFDLGSGGLTTHWSHQRRPARFIEFLKSLANAYPGQRVLAIMESGAIPITRSVWEFLNSESGRLELVFHSHPTRHHKRIKSTQKLDTERRDSNVCFLFNSPERVIENLRKDFGKVKKQLPKEAAFSLLSLREGGS